MHKTTASECSYLFCNSFLSLIMAAHLGVLERLNKISFFSMVGT